MMLSDHLHHVFAILSTSALVAATSPFQEAALKAGSSIVAGVLTYVITRQVAKLFDKKQKVAEVKEKPKPKKRK